MYWLLKVFLYFPADPRCVLLTNVHVYQVLVLPWQVSGLYRRPMYWLLKVFLYFPADRRSALRTNVQVTKCFLVLPWQVPGLYKPEELEPLLMPLRDQAAQEGYRGSFMTYFSERE